MVQSGSGKLGSRSVLLYLGTYTHSSQISTTSGAPLYAKVRQQGEIGTYWSSRATVSYLFLARSFHRSFEAVNGTEYRDIPLLNIIHSSTSIPKLQKIQILVSYLATSQVDAASLHWSEVGCMRFHRIAHPFFPVRMTRKKRLAKCILVRLIVV